MDYEAIVIGSGFGGTVAATKLAAAGKRVLILERGGWWVSPISLPPKKPAKPGDPPPPTQRQWLENDRKKQLADAGRTETDELVNFWARPDHARGLLDLVAAVRTRWNPDGLWSYRRFEEAHIPVANGVGGGSLTYSNVTIRPKQQVLDRIGLRLGDPEYTAALDWMKQYRGPTNQVVTKTPVFPGLGLNVSALDDVHEYLYLDKSRVLKKAAAQAEAEVGLKLPWAPLDLSIVEYDPQRTKVNPDGSLSLGAADQNHTFCQRQGRCLFGCLPQAKHTLNKSLWKWLLMDPKFKDTVELRERAEVTFVRRVGGGYQVTYRDRMKGKVEEQVSAPMVFLAAGVLGTTELLLKCRAAGALRVSDRLGHGFSTNGDFGGFAVGTTEKVYSTHGPINTCHLEIELEDGMCVTVEDGGLPAIVAELARFGLHALDAYITAGKRWRKWWFKLRMRLFWYFRWLHPAQRWLRPKARGPRQAKTAGGSQARPSSRWKLPGLSSIFPDTAKPERYQTEAEMVEDIFFFNSMGEDEANGIFSLERSLFDVLLRRPGHLDLTWERTVAGQAVFKRIAEIQRKLAEAMGGRYLPMPFWDGFTEKKLVIPHPLGGCGIGPTREQGVVDEHGRVFDGEGADLAATLPGLYIVDGSVIPGALAVNPTLTITAQALKTMDTALR